MKNTVADHRRRLQRTVGEHIRYVSYRGFGTQAECRWAVFQRDQRRLILMPPPQQRHTRRESPHHPANPRLKEPLRFRARIESEATDPPPVTDPGPLYREGSVKN